MAASPKRRLLPLPPAGRCSSPGPNHSRAAEREAGRGLSSGAGMRSSCVTHSPDSPPCGRRTGRGGPTPPERTPAPDATRPDPPCGSSGTGGDDETIAEVERRLGEERRMAALPRAIVEIAAEALEAGLESAAELGKGGDGAAHAGVEIGVRPSPVRAEESIRAIVRDWHGLGLDAA